MEKIKDYEKMILEYKLQRNHYELWISNSALLRVTDRRSPCKTANMLCVFCIICECDLRWQEVEWLQFFWFSSSCSLSFCQGSSRSKTRQNFTSEILEMKTSTVSENWDLRKNIAHDEAFTFGLAELGPTLWFRWRHLCPPPLPLRSHSLLRSQSQLRAQWPAGLRPQLRLRGCPAKYNRKYLYVKEYSR